MGGWGAGQGALPAACADRWDTWADFLGAVRTDVSPGNRSRRGQGGELPLGSRVPSVTISLTG